MSFSFSCLLTTIKADVNALVVDTEVEAEERPKSPWTPSYSVTTPPGSPRVPIQSEIEQSESVPVSEETSEEISTLESLPSINEKKTVVSAVEPDMLLVQTAEHPAETSPIDESIVEEASDHSISEPAVVESFENSPSDPETTPAPVRLSFCYIASNTNCMK